MRVRKLYRPSERDVSTPPEQKKVMKVHDTGVSDEILDVLVESFDYLYDPDNMDHLPMDKKMGVYAKRDLYKAKYYHTALKYFGKQRSIMEMLGANKGRQRVIVAPLMKTQMKVDKYAEYDQPIYNTPMIIKPKLPALPIDKTDDDTAHEMERKMEDFKTSLRERQAIQKDMASIGDIEKWLSGKPDKSELEKQAHNKILKSRHKFRPQEKVPDRPVLARPTKQLPIIDRPTPVALHVIQQELAKRQLRLVDLFTNSDKDKDWSLSREELRRTFDQAEIAIQDEFLEDLMVTLDRDNSNRLYYSDLAVAMKNLIVEQRSTSSASNATNLSDIISMSSKAGSPTGKVKADERLESPTSNLSIPASDFKEETLNDTPVKVGSSVINKSFPRSRKTTPTDSLSTEQESTMKTNFSRPQKGRTLTGYPPFDNHTAPSQLTGEHVQSINRYRQDRLQEYMKIMKLCQQSNIVLDEKLFERVLLHPGDKPAKKIRKSIRQPGAKSEFHREAFYKPSLPGGPSTGGRPGDISPEAGTAGLKSTNLLALLGGKFAFQQGGGGVSPLMERSDSIGWNDRSDDGGSTHGSSSVAAMSEGRTIYGGIAGVNLHQVGHTLPRNEDFEVDDEDEEFRVHLSTGWATVKKKVDCWLTFEDFLRLTSRVESKFDHSDITPVDHNAFWPGALLHKFRLYMDSNIVSTAVGKGAVFQEVRRPVRSVTSLAPVHKMPISRKPLPVT